MESKFAFAQQLIKQAGNLVKRHMLHEFDVMVKGRLDDIVTSIDIAVQEFMAQALMERYPDDQILAEENEARSANGLDRTWVIDPIDGTVNFVTQGADFAIMLSYFEDGSGQFGLIYDVMADKLYSGGKCFPVTCNEVTLKPFNHRHLKQSLIACNTGMLLHNRYGLQEALKEAMGIRNYGCAGLSMTRVLENKLWGYVSNVYPWDYAAGAILGEVLGYTLVTLDGQVPDYQSRQEIMFVPSVFVEAILGKLNHPNDTVS